MALRFSEEIVLLALDDRSGKLRHLPERALDLAVAGALLMELAFANRIDTDTKDLHVLDRSATGDPLLDRVLGLLPDDNNELTIRHALSRVATEAPKLRESLFKDLIEKGILKREEHRLFFVLKERCYPMIDDREEKEVVARIREVVIDNALPDPKDVVLVCLMDACDLSTTVFSEEELDHHRDRIREVARMDLIGQALARSIQEIQEAILETVTYMGM